MATEINKKEYNDKTIYETGIWEIEIYYDGEIHINCHDEFTNSLVVDDSLFLKIIEERERRINNNEK